MLNVKIEFCPLDWYSSKHEFCPLDCFIQQHVYVKSDSKQLPKAQKKKMRFT